MAKNIEMGVRSMIASKQSQIKIVDGREPSLKELAEDKPVMRMVPGKGLIMYVRHGNQRYHMKFSSDPRQLGRVRVEDIEPDPLMGTKLLDDDVLPVIPSSKGGLGDDFSGASTGFIRMINGTATQRSYLNTKSDLSLNLVDNTSDSTKQTATLSAADKDDVGLSNVENVDQTDADNITSGTLSNTVQDNITRVGTVGSGTWGATAVAVDKGGTGAVSAGAARTALSTLTQIPIYGGPDRMGYAGASDDNTPGTDQIWLQTDTTYVPKIVINYVHAENIVSLYLNCFIRRTVSGLGGTGYVKIAVYAADCAGGTSAIATDTSSVLASQEEDTTSANYVHKQLSKCVVSGLTNGTMYRVRVEIKSSGSGDTCYLTGVTISALAS